MNISTPKLAPSFFAFAINPAADFFYGNAIVIRKVISPLPNTCGLCKPGDHYQLKEKCEIGFSHGFFGINLWKQAFSEHSE